MAWGDLEEVELKQEKEDTGCTGSGTVMRVMEYLAQPSIFSSNYSEMDTGYICGVQLTVSSVPHSYVCINALGGVEELSVEMEYLWS